MRLIRIVRIALVSAVLGFPLAPFLVGEALAGPFEDAEAAYNAQNYEAALKGLDPLAHAGNAKAQYLLGRMYALGRAVTQNYAEALKWYHQAAAQGSSDAQNGIANLYVQGKGVARDDKEALKWYRLSAAQGNASGENGLAGMYSMGLGGIGKDPVRAHMWYVLSAAQGNATAASSKDFNTKKLTAPEIAQAEALAAKCKASNYKDCGW